MNKDIYKNKYICVHKGCGRGCIAIVNKKTEPNNCLIYVKDFVKWKLESSIILWFTQGDG